MMYIIKDMMIMMYIMLLLMVRSFVLKIDIYRWRPGYVNTSKLQIIMVPNVESSDE